MENNELIKKDKTIKTDRLRFSKNKLPALLCYLGIVLNVLYFISIYKTNDGYFYQALMGISVISNLIIMLASFLSSEGIKNYKWKFAIALFVLAAIQIVRIFIYPLKALNQETPVIDGGHFARLVIYLVGSAASYVAAGVIGMIRSKKLENYVKSLHSEK